MEVEDKMGFPVLKYNILLSAGCWKVRSLAPFILNIFMKLLFRVMVGFICIHVIRYHNELGQSLLILKRCTIWKVYRSMVKDTI